MKKGGTGRRTVLQRGLTLLAGGVAVGAGARTVRAEEPAAPVVPTATPAVSTLTLYARKRPVAGPPRATRGAHTPDARTLASGELLDSPGGRAIGSFHTNCFCMGTPLGPHNHAASNLEFQVLQLADGTLFGISGGGASDMKAHAVVGGTGRYAGARGSYIERPAEGRGAKRDVMELVVTLAG